MDFFLCQGCTGQHEQYLSFLKYQIMFFVSSSQACHPLRLRFSSAARFFFQRLCRLLGESRACEMTGMLGDGGDNVGGCGGVGQAALAKSTWTAARCRHDISIPSFTLQPHTRRQHTDVTDTHFHTSQPRLFVKGANPSMLGCGCVSGARRVMCARGGGPVHAYLNVFLLSWL